MKLFQLVLYRPTDLRIDSKVSFIIHLEEDLAFIVHPLPVNTRLFELDKQIQIDQSNPTAAFHAQFKQIFIQYISPNHFIYHIKKFVVLFFFSFVLVVYVTIFFFVQY